MVRSARRQSRTRGLLNGSSILAVEAPQLVPVQVLGGLGVLLALHFGSVFQALLQFVQVVEGDEVQQVLPDEAAGRAAFLLCSGVGATVVGEALHLKELLGADNVHWFRPVSLALRLLIL